MPPVDRPPPKRHAPVTHVKPGHRLELLLLLVRRTQKRPAAASRGVIAREFMPSSGAAADYELAVDREDLHPINELAQLPLP